MGVNRGKDFEDRVKQSFEKINGLYILRIYDTMQPYAGVANPCDFIIKYQDIMLLLECKSCYKASLPFSNISDTQWRELTKAEFEYKIPAGFMIWFIDKDVTVYVPASEMVRYRTEHHRESFSYEDAEEYGIIIPGKKKKVYFDYDMSVLFRKV